MCGFLVFIHNSSPHADISRPLGKTLELLHHRGPHDTAVETVDGGAVTMGFKRLAIIDQHGSRQPLSYPPDGPEAGRYLLVFNGEIYNFEALREELRREHGASFATQGDAEVLAAAHFYWGDGALDRLRGMFAFVLWDRTAGVMRAARDPFGIKPLYYLPTVDGLWLASEKKALMPFVPAYAGVDPYALAHFVTFQYVPEPDTLHRDVARLGAGHRMTYTPGGVVKAERYFRPMFHPDRSADLESMAARVRDALRDSVRAHMRADVPVGAFLSSGIDSTAIVALARESHPALHTFTVGTDVDGYSEVELAAETAEALGVRLTATRIGAAEVIDHLPTIIWHLDDPVADPSLVPLYFLARTAAEHVTVTLSGEGADELFGGYTIYREPASLRPVSRLPAPLPRALAALSALIPEGVRGKSFLRRAGTPLPARYYGNARNFSPSERRTLLRLTDPLEPTRVTGPIYAEAAGLDEATAMQYVDMRTWLPGDILTKADRMSMAHSLELRVPFLDREVFAVAARVRTELKLPRGSATTKYVLRQAMRGMVPPTAVDRPKLGFPTPVRVWLRGDLGEWADQIIAGSPARYLLDLSYARRLLAEHRRGKADHSRKVWTVLTFCLWHAITVERSLSPRPAPAATFGESSW